MGHCPDLLHHTEKIMNMNQMESEEIRRGDHLIIMKELERVKC